VRAQGGRATGQEKAGAPFFVGEEDYRDRGGVTAVGGDRLPREASQILLNPRSERRVEST